MEIKLREVREEDLAVLFEQQRDEAANWMAAFTVKDPGDWEAYERRWKRVLADETVMMRAVLVGEELAGSVLVYEEDGRPEVSYWLGRAYWGKGIATAALREFLNLLEKRPVYARTVKDNTGSLRVLEKCGFKVVAEERGFANARGAEVEEYLLRLDEAGG